MIPPVIIAICAILTCQLAGEILGRSIGLPVPGPVTGMALMLVVLTLSARLRAIIRPLAETILGNLLLLFVPAFVGATLQIPALGEAALPLTLAAVASTLLTILVAVGCFRLTARLVGEPRTGGQK